MVATLRRLARNRGPVNSREFMAAARHCRLDSASTNYTAPAGNR